MSEDNVENQVAPEKEVLEQSGDEKTEVSSENAQSQTEGTVQAEESTEKEPESITLSKQELDSLVSKKKAIAERKARREYETKLQQELAKTQQQSSNVQQTQATAIPPQPSPDHIWDDALGWIHKDTTSDQKYSMLVNALTSIAQQPQQQQQPVQQSQLNASTPQMTANQVSNFGVSTQAIDQLDEHIVEIPDFAETLKAAGSTNSITADMLNAAALAPDGMKMLYDLQKENPLELHKISQLSPDAQKFKVWEMQKKRAGAPKKVATKATPQPEPLDTSGTVNTKREDMDLAQRRAHDLKKQWSG